MTLPPRRTASLRSLVLLLLFWTGLPAEEPHWAFTAPKRPALPSKHANPIDAFVQTKLQEKDLKPSPEADRRTLIHRVSFDLTGLPPTVEEVEAFLLDASPHAYEKLVDRLLGSPH